MNEDPKVCIERETLRKDLYYRLNVIFLKIPPLRDRKEDIPLLMDHFIQRYNFKFGKLVIRVSDEVKHLFKEYQWPGNVRELEHAIESALNLITEDTLTLEHIPIHLIEASDVPGEEVVSLHSVRPYQTQRKNGSKKRWMRQTGTSKELQSYSKSHDKRSNISWRKLLKNTLPKIRRCFSFYGRFEMNCPPQDPYPCKFQLVIHPFLPSLHMM